MKRLALAFAFALAAAPAMAHEGFEPSAEVIHDTPEWKGERFADGRPKVADNILDRMKSVTLEEAWATLRAAGYEHNYEGGWADLFPGKIMVGRALTSMKQTGPKGAAATRSISPSGVFSRRARIR